MTTFEILEISSQVIKITGFIFLYLEVRKIRQLKELDKNAK